MPISIPQAEAKCSDGHALSSKTLDWYRDGRYRDEQQLREYLALIGSENERLSRLTENFLTLARLERTTEKPAVEPLELSSLLEDALRPFRPTEAAWRIP